MYGENKPFKGIFLFVIVAIYKVLLSFIAFQLNLFHMFIFFIEGKLTLVFVKM